MAAKRFAIVPKSLMLICTVFSPLTLRIFSRCRPRYGIHAPELAIGIDPFLRRQTPRRPNPQDDVRAVAHRSLSILEGSAWPHGEARAVRRLEYGAVALALPLRNAHDDESRARDLPHRAGAEIGPLTKNHVAHVARMPGLSVAAASQHFH